MLIVDDAVELVDDAAGDAVAPLVPPEPEAAVAFFWASVAAFSCFS